jgi:hypothetical protein
VNAQQSLFDPRARLSDPIASHLAAAVVKDGNDELVKRIRRLVTLWGPLSAWEIADRIVESCGDRWDGSTIRTACARAGLHKSSDPYLRSPRGRPCHAYTMDTETVRGL